MTEGLVGLFISMLIIAVIPGPAVFAITTTSMNGGFRRGLNMTIGLLLADFVFILLAVSGLGILAASIGPAFVVIKYASAAYLIWMGINLLLSSNRNNYSNQSVKASSDVFAGFVLTISNPKAIVFYVGLFPAFINFYTVNVVDVFMIMVCAFFAFGSVNLGYAYLASKINNLASKPGAHGIIKKTSGSILALTGVIVAVRA